MSLVTCSPIIARVCSSVFILLKFRQNLMNQIQDIEKGIFWDQKWPNLGLKDGHARARMGEHVTKLTSLHSFHTKNISSKFHRNLMKQIQDILENVHFQTQLANCHAHFCNFCPISREIRIVGKSFCTLSIREKKVFFDTWTCQSRKIKINGLKWPKTKKAYRLLFKGVKRISKLAHSTALKIG